MPTSTNIVAASIVTVIVLSAACLAYVDFLYVISHTTLSQRLKRNGYYGCSHYRHSDVLFGSDYQKKTFEAITRGERQAWIRGNFERYGQTYEVVQWGKFQYLDYSVDLLLGDDVNMLAGDSSKLNAEAFITACDQSLLQVARSQTPWLLRWYNGWTKDWNRQFRTSQAFVDHQVQAALKRHENGTPSYAFIDELVRQTGSNDRRYLRNQMLNIFFLARDASGIAISLVIFQLARHLEVYVKIRKEVFDAGLDQGVSYEALKNLSYVDAVINETLRLHGPTGHALRDVLVDTVLPRGGGLKGDQPLFVPKGAAVVVHMHALQRDRRSWGEDANIFRPERWLEDSKSAQRRGWEYLPFLGGSRVCPGQPMVLAQLAYIIVAFVRKFCEIRNRDPEERLIEEHRILMKIRNGVHVELVL